jgi:hypothetical protein
MSKAIKVTFSKVSDTDRWPLFNLTRIVANNSALTAMGVVEHLNTNSFNALLNLGEILSMDIDINDQLVIDGYYVFPSDESFTSQKDAAYAHIPTWKFSADSDTTQYYIDNHITVTFEEVENPDLTNYTQITYLTSADLANIGL